MWRATGARGALSEVTRTNRFLLSSNSSALLGALADLSIALFAAEGRRQGQIRLSNVLRCCE